MSSTALEQFRYAALATCTIAFAGGICSAQVRVLKPRPPLLAPTDKQPGNPDHVGPKVQMPVSLNIDRHLRKAQTFLDRNKFSSAFRVLQDVIEGRTLVDDDPDGAESDPGEEEDAAGGERVVPTVVSAKQAVFTSDDRIYRPVRRLCHEMLASLAPDGLAAYRAEFEYLAEQELRAATANLDAASLERVSDRFFVTLSSARALEAAGDLRLDAGQFRAALQDFRLLLEIYPELGRAEAGIDDAYLHLRIALCLAWLGDVASARETLATLADQAGTQSTLRVGGELIATGGLAELPMFTAVSEGTPVADSARPSSPDGASAFLVSEVVPLWEFRFEEPRPYRPISEKSRRKTRVFGGRNSGGPLTSIRPPMFAPGNSVLVHDTRMSFVDHFRLRTYDALSGRMLAESDEALHETLKPHQPRARVATYDYLSARVIEHAGKHIVIVGSAYPSNGIARVLDNRIIAYDANTYEPSWTSEAHVEFNELTFLAAPTPFGNDQLLVPVFDRGTIALQALDATTGVPAWRVTVHRGGTNLSRPLASPIVVDQGIAYILSNAGAIAAVDAHAGELRWIRRYERVHPIRPEPLHSNNRRAQSMFFGQGTYQELTRLPGFAPNDILAIDGTVVFAPSDGGVLHCLDGTTGEPIWMLNRSQDVPAGNKSRSLYIVGHEDHRLLIGGEYDVYCVDLRTGVRLWRAELENIGGTSRWRGRGLVVDGHVLVPGQQEILIRPIGGSNSGTWRSVPLPELSIGRESLEGPFNIGVEGVYLTAAYAGGVAVYSTVADLLAESSRAQQPEQRALLQAQAGDLLAAFATLEAADVRNFEDAGRKANVTRRLLSIGSELALAMAAHDAERDVMSILDRVRVHLETERDIKRWHLIRIEVFDALGNVEMVQAQQRELYRLMEDGGD